MIISIVNRSHSLADEDVQAAVRAINRQIAEDFEPYWSFGATLRLEGSIGDQPDKQKLEEMRGDAILYLWDDANVADALGYHEANFRGIPYGFVFTELCKKLDEKWSVTLSHEALELVGDAQGNLLVQGPHPQSPDKEVFHWFEMCDAVQSQTYEIDNVAVANFVLPLYFTSNEQVGGRNDFLGRLHDGEGLHSFCVAPGGYIGFYDPQTRTHQTYAAPNDKKAQKRLKAKAALKVGRGYLRSHGDATLNREAEHAEALRRDPAQRSTPGDAIRHVVVLMLENHSFDQMLGDASRVYSDLDGVPQHGPVYQNIASSSGTVYRQTPMAAATVSPDPGHDLVDVLKQLGDATSTPMGGFVDSYLSMAGVRESHAGQVEQVMAYYALGDDPRDDTLPALHALARNFRVCDHWFSSMPGPTWPNRFFAHSGTCLGHVLMPSRQHPGNMRIYAQDTLYDRLDDADKSWRIYHDGTPQSIVMTHLLPELLTSHYASMDDFADDASGPADDFPDYVFIEPSYSGKGENDQHPPSDIARGDQLIASVYNAIRSNDALWKSTLLIVTYDEHGGFFDHVPPPATIAPDENVSEYAFNRLGVRVPALLVSPWVPRGVCKTQLDHTSILRYVCDKWNLPPLGARTAPAAGPLRANSFAPELGLLGTAREDTPKAIAARPSPRARSVAVEPPVEGSREALLWFMANLRESPLNAPTHAARQMAARVAVSRKGTALRPMTDAQLRRAAEKRYRELMAQKAVAEPVAMPARTTKAESDAERLRAIRKQAPRARRKMIKRRTPRAAAKSKRG